MIALRSIVFALILSLLTFGCSDQKPKDGLVLWTAFEGVELETLRQRLTEFEEESGFRVTLLKVPFKSLQRKVLIAGPAQQGPDVLLAPHDWIGLLETADMLAPVPSSVLSPDDQSFFPIAIRAVTYDGNIYSVPMMMDCVVLARNTTLCPKKPENLDQLVQVAKECQERGNGVLGFAYELDNLYFSWGFLKGFGADFFAPFLKKDLDVDSIEFASPANLKGSQWVSDLRLIHKMVPKGMENQTAVDFFLNDKLGMMLVGPWNLGAMRKAQVPYELQVIPEGPAGLSSPFVGVIGAMLNRYSVDKPGVSELLTFLGSAETVSRLCQSSGRAPSRVEASEMLKKMIEDPVVIRDIALFSDAAQRGTPIPNHPAVAAVWEPMKQALELVTTGQSTPEVEFARTTERVRAKIRFMME